MSSLSIELSEVFCHWQKDSSQINCRISLKSNIQVIKYHQQVLFHITNPLPTDQVHILIQEENIVLGSQTVTLEWMFGTNLNSDLDEWISIEVPSESIFLITKQQVQSADAKSLRIRLTGKLIKQENPSKSLDPDPILTPTFPNSSFVSSNQTSEGPLSYKIKVGSIDEPQEEFKRPVDHRKMPSEADSLEKEPFQVSDSIKNSSHLPEKNQIPNFKDPVEKLQKPEGKNSGVKSPYRSPRSKSPPARTEKLSPPSSPKELLIPKPAVEKKSPQPDQKSMKIPQTGEKPGQSSDALKKPSTQFTFSEATEGLTKNNEIVKPKDPNDSISVKSSELSSENENEKEEEIPEHVSRARPTKIKLSAESVNNPCGYLKNVVRVEFHLKTIMSILNRLKEEMGGAFIKLIEESTRRDSRSPTRSPSRKITNSGLRTPGMSRASVNNVSVISSFRVEEENVLELPGFVDVFLDRLSVKNADVLSTCIVGTLAKSTYGKVQTKEIDPTKDMINIQEKSRDMINDSMKATTKEYKQECDNFDVMIKRLKDEIASINHSIESTRKKSQLLVFEKSTYEKNLVGIKSEREEILKKYNATIDLDSIKQLRKANETLEKARIEMEEKLSAYAIQFKSTFEGSAALQNKYIEEKSSSLSEVKSLTSIIDNIERENHKLRSELQGLNGFVYVDEEQRRMLSNYQNNSRSHSQNLDSIRTQLTYLRSQKEDLSNDAYELQQKIEAETKRVKTSQNGWNKEIEMNNETISNLNKDFKKLKQGMNYIEDVYNKKLNVENALEVIISKSKHNQETKDQLISELSYFSDFVFSLSQTFLQQKRIFGKVKSIVSEKDMEVEAMRTAVHELKQNNPVYTSVPEDIIDQAVADYFNSRDDVLIVPFVREAYGVYMYGSKKVMVSIERGKLIVKVGGGFLPIEVFIDNYTDVELDKFENKTVEVSPKMKRFLGKWVGGLNPRQVSPEKMKEGLLKALEGKKFTQAFAVRDIKPVLVSKKVREDFLTPDRPETPIIEEDI
ncbi:hypothetical protein SteCoe_8493 [Stentor coeruleus]|uniref:GAR domain-containing protein n=1 Tax=Stentor coeruleus TaxID=5963 RepID=A0A1R2CKC3_9CILI|nr:hypothetical protein SteCoe_8493 [Stentor coeruleus]